MSVIRYFTILSNSIRRDLINRTTTRNLIGMDKLSNMKLFNYAMILRQAIAFARSIIPCFLVLAYQLRTYVLENRFVFHRRTMTYRLFPCTRCRVSQWSSRTIVRKREELVCQMFLVYILLLLLLLLLLDYRYLQACAIGFLNDACTCFHGCRIIFHEALSLACLLLVEKPLTQPKLVYELVTLASLNSRWYAPSRSLCWSRLGWTVTWLMRRHMSASATNCVDWWFINLIVHRHSAGKESVSVSRILLGRQIKSFVVANGRRLFESLGSEFISVSKRNFWVWSLDC